MNIGEQQIERMAQEINCGLDCYLDKETGDFLTLPDENELMNYESEAWEETIEEIKSNPNQYIHIRQMNSSEAYLVMERFAEQLEAGALKDNLFNALNRRKPFRNFKDIIDFSDHRQDWFDFEHRAKVEWVKKQLEEIE